MFDSWDPNPFQKNYKPKQKEQPANSGTAETTYFLYM